MNNLFFYSGIHRSLFEEKNTKNSEYPVKRRFLEFFANANTCMKAMTVCKKRKRDENDEQIHVK
jgi:hypothetical protein